MALEPQTAQSAKQAAVRAVTGTESTWEGDWHALFDMEGIAAGDFNGRMLRWINSELSASYTNLPEAQQALATARDAYNWSSLGSQVLSGVATPVTGDILNVEILGSTPIVTSPVNNIDCDGRVAAITIKGLGTGLARDYTKGRIMVRRANAYTGGVLTTYDEWVYFNEFLRMPFPKAWATGAVIPEGEWRSTRPASVGLMWEVVSNNGGATSTVAPTTGSVTTYDTTHGPLADGYVWKYLGNPTNRNPVPAKRIETVSGSDIIVYAVLSESLADGDTIVDHDFEAGFYGTSLASNSAFIDFTHSQTWLRPQPHVVSLTQPHQLLQPGDGDLVLESVVETHSGRAGRPFDLHRWIIKSSAGITVATIDRQLVEDSTLATGGENVQVARAAYDWSGLTSGDYYIFQKCFPFEGRVWDSETDGAGSATLSPTAALTANEGKFIHFTVDQSSAIVRYHAVVNPAGAGATPSVSATFATADLATNHFATVKAAQTALNTAGGGNGCSAATIWMMAGDYTTGWGGNLGSGVTVGKIPMTIAKHPTAAAATDGSGYVNIVPGSGVSTANKIGYQKCIYDGIKITGGASWKGIDNSQTSAAGVGDFGYESWFRNCDIVGGESLGRFGLIHEIRNGRIQSMGNNFGRSAGRSALRLIVGNVLQKGGTISAMHWIGNISDSEAGAYVSPTPAGLDATYWAEGTGTTTYQNAQFQMYMFNSFRTCTQTPTIHYGNGAEKGDVVRGLIWSMNFVEVADARSPFAQADAKGGQLSADGNSSPLGYLIFNDNTVIGDGVNLVYNENGTARGAKHLYARRNNTDDWNLKGGHWDQSTSHENKTGNYFVRFKTDQKYNVVYGQGSFDPNPSPGNNFGDAEGRDNFGGGVTRSFTDDKSFYAATKTGGGTYTPTGSDGAIGAYPANENAWPKDLDGTTRVTDGTGAVGAFEKAA